MRSRESVAPARAGCAPARPFRPRTRKLPAPLAIPASLLLILTACRPAAPPLRDSVSDTVERGPLRLVVEAWPKEVLIADPVTVEVRMRAPANYVVKLPPAEAFGELAVTKFESVGPRTLPDGAVEWCATIRIEPMASGELEIPPLAVAYAASPAAVDRTGQATETGGAQRPEPRPEPPFDDELVSGTLKVAVRSALTTQDSVMRPRDITGTLLRPWRMPWWQWLLLLAAAAVLAALIGLAVWWIRRVRSRPPPPILPEVWALRELAELERRRWVEEGRVREYYYRLSGIVRAYIERKFALSAPEMTTEEFLTMLARRRGALPYDTDRLRAFLEACDIVKYAAFCPLREDADAALAGARAFIHATAATAAAPQPATPAGQAA